ncbi:MAG: glycine cleavage system protein R [Isosphaeraceae bacterium]|jgi:glycine cleavage system transcriptional repressor|nr:MAG: glycine cleavage system protein R [Isosphaeraceae bacterium]
MPARVVLTLTGPDQIGIVDKLTGHVLEHGGNVEMSRMARLGGEFAVLMLVALPDERSSDALMQSLASLTASGYTLTLSPSRTLAAEPHPGWVPYRIDVHGADHEGIIHEVAHYLSAQGISIDEMESECSPAPTSGTPLFAMTANIVVPPGLDPDAWRPGLAEIARRLNLEIEVIPIGRSGA